ncbi:hypothetical protein QAD02_009727 [Eretmocerus hayati]|uniref:Uncharacterized protein n=1 Tax=Eretmocerus hayati TaxID=131215 RepID=A0ACC2NA57_9HYME|nr:hypothetical protein QAD02_009727 [Eretmocerus hayati]
MAYERRKLSIMMLGFLIVVQIFGLGLADCNCNQGNYCVAGCNHVIQRHHLPHLFSIDGDESSETDVKELPSTDVSFMRKSCVRGCKFFDIVDQSVDTEPIKNLNNSMEDCLTMCDEEYVDKNEQKMGCRLGCRMRIHRLDHQQTDEERPKSLFDRRSEPIFYLLIDLVDDQGLSKKIFMADKHEADRDLDEGGSADISVSSSWADALRVFQAMIKGTESSDYGVLAESVPDESDKPTTSLPGSDWLRCASRHTGIPGWLLAFAIAAAALSALWLCLAPEKPTDCYEKVTLVKPDDTCKLTVYLPDEAPLHKKPPPKYHEVVDIDDPNIQV